MEPKQARAGTGSRVLGDTTSAGRHNKQTRNLPVNVDTERGAEYRNGEEVTDASPYSMCCARRHDGRTVLAAEVRRYPDQKKVAFERLR